MYIYVFPHICIERDRYRHIDITLHVHIHTCITYRCMYMHAGVTPRIPCTEPADWRRTEPNNCTRLHYTSTNDMEYYTIVYTTLYYTIPYLGQGALHFTITFHYYILPLHVTITFYHYMLPLHFTVTFYHYILPFLVTITF